MTITSVSCYLDCYLTENTAHCCYVLPSSQALLIAGRLGYLQGGMKLLNMAQGSVSIFKRQSSVFTFSQKPSFLPGKTWKDIHNDGIKYIVRHKCRNISNKATDQAAMQASSYKYRAPLKEINLCSLHLSLSKATVLLSAFSTVDFNAQ